MKGGSKVSINISTFSDEQGIKFLFYASKNFVFVFFFLRTPLIITLLVKKTEGKRRRPIHLHLI